jgi:ABC-type phosphate transport system permease subunit
MRDDSVPRCHAARAQSGRERLELFEPSLRSLPSNGVAIVVGSLACAKMVIPITRNACREVFFALPQIQRKLRHSADPSLKHALPIVIASAQPGIE